MMTMRPPQHGHGCAGGLGSLASAQLVSAASDCAAGTASSSRARAMLSARVPLASSPFDSVVLLPYYITINRR